MDYTAFRHNLRQLIQSRGKSVKCFSMDINITEATISRYLSGSRTPDLPYVVKIAEYFGVSVDWLLGLSGDKFEVMPPHLQEVLTLYSRANQYDRNVVQVVLAKYRLPDDK